MIVSINNRSQLVSLLDRTKRVSFIFEFSALSSDENQLWMEKIKRNYFACGCNMGKIFMTYALLITSAGVLFLYFFQRSKFSFIVGVYTVLLIFIMAGIGKAVGKLIAYENLVMAQ